MKAFLVFFSVILFFCASHFDVEAQTNQHWALLNTPAAFATKEITPYFLNENLGFCFIPGKQTLYRTTNGGNTWNDISSLTTNFINQLYFVGIGHGYLASPKAIYETNDTGSSWKVILQTKINFIFKTVYSSAGKIFIGAERTYQNFHYDLLLVSSNDGIKWDTVLTSPPIKYTSSLGSYVLGNKEGLVCTEIPDTSGTFSYILTSADTGKTWVSTPANYSTEGIFSFPHCDDLLRTSFNGGDVYQIEHFINSGWSNSFPDVETGAWVTGCTCALYVCNAAPLHPIGQLDSDGLLRSTDRGLTWQYILGPETVELDDVDFHNISVVGGGAVVYLGDTYGNLWKTVDGGDGSLSSVALAPKIGFHFEVFPGNKDTIKSKLCDSSQIHISLQNLSCNYAQLQSIIISGLDSEQYTTSINHHLPCENTPDSLFIKIKALTVGTYKLKIHLRFSNDEFQIIDTSFTVILNIDKGPDTKVIFTSPHLGTSDTIDFGRQALCVSGGKDTLFLSNPSCISIQVKKISLETDPGSGNDFSISAPTPFMIRNDTPPEKIITTFHPLTTGIKTGRIIIVTNFGVDTIFLHSIIDSTGTFHLSLPQLNFDSVSTCISVTSTTYLINNSCDSVLVAEAQSPKRGSFLGPSIPIPVWLHAKDSLKVTVTFSPRSVGLELDSVIFFEGDGKGYGKYITLILSGYGEPAGRGLSYAPKQFNFQSLSICSHDSASGFVTNIGCDSVHLDPAQIFGDPDYKFSALSPQPSALKPGDTLSYEVYLNPTKKGLRQGFLILTSNDKINTTRDTIPFTVTVIGGTVILSSSITAADFGSVPVCDERDTLVTLYNSGCDTMVVTGYNISGSGFGTDTKFPITILPGKDTVIHIFTLLDTAGGKNVTSGTLSFTSNSDNTLPAITLTRAFIQSTRRDVGLYLDAQAKAAGALSFVSYDIRELPGKTFAGAGIKNVNFDLNYNTNLLTFTQAKSNNVTSIDGKTFTISGNPVVADKNGVLATVGFQVYLTKDSVTNIDMTSRTDTSIMPCGIMTLSAGGSATFDYNFLCGERSIAGFMNGSLPMRIVSLHPNPSQDEVILDLQSAVKENAQLEIYDALGIKVFSATKNITIGSSSLHLDTRSIPSGMYLLRIGGGSQSLVISK